MQCGCHALPKACAQPLEGGKDIVVGYKLLSMCGAVAITSGGLFLLGTTSASGRQAPVVITAPADDVVTRHISYADLNLASPAGEKALTSRVRGAITGLCAEATSAMAGAYGHATEEFKCDSEAWGQARPQMAVAVQRAREIAFTGTSNLAAVAISISLSE